MFTFARNRTSLRFRANERMTKIKKGKQTQERHDAYHACAQVEAAGFKRSRVPTRDLMRSNKLAELRKSDRDRPVVVQKL